MAESKFQRYKKDMEAKKARRRLGLERMLKSPSVRLVDIIQYPQFVPERYRDTVTSYMSS
jgi:hypothetical protein